ncbi:MULTISPECIES: hypothetical protein [Deefgea]|uniref:SnoaL-like domain-containing protein n=1 Tax=Deefgea chitinilytica TaxID=570276 RepID=A0ABS2CEX0_9NEIS|nr:MULTISPECIES: hypothetical protein [Deefgea]MBM5572681.1 hypothetical protein [Deefgea chitinilytica]MBM9889917.1 hypothetical protein [Deefgea sp. CFH1-16]
MNLEEFFEHFSVAYSQLDVDGVTQLFAMPFFTLINDERTDWPEMAPLYETTQILFNWYAAQGFHDAQYKILSLLEISSTLGTAQLAWRVIRNDGTPWEYRTSYHLKRVNNVWKISGVIQFEEETPNVANLTSLASDAPLLVVAEAALRNHIVRPNLPIATQEAIKQETAKSLI